MPATFRRLQKQLEGIRQQKDPQFEKIFERVSLSENEKDSYKDDSHSEQKDKVYRYFSNSAKVDSDLFNYKKYFSDIPIDKKDDSPEHFLEDFIRARKPAQTNQNSNPLEVESMPKNREIDNCPSCTTHTECIRCHRKLAVYCKDCDEHNKVSPEATNHLQIEYSDAELPLDKNQQVVVYRSSDQHAPYSFNIPPQSIFYKETLDDVLRYNEMKLSNYIKLYGDLRTKKLESSFLKNPENFAGAIPKQKTAALNKKIVLTPTHSSKLESILDNAQYTVITQIGFAKQQLDKDKLKV